MTIEQKDMRMYEVRTASGQLVAIVRTLWEALDIAHTADCLFIIDLDNPELS